MMGVKPAQMGKELADAGVTALGINCGRSLEDNYKALQELRPGDAASAVVQAQCWFTAHG